MISFLKRLLGLDDNPEVRDLALQAESGVRKLNGLPPRPDTAPNDLKNILASVCLLLNRAGEQRAAYVEHATISPRPLTAREDKMLKPHVEPERSPQSAPPIEVQPSLAVSSTISPTAKELIKLRDWVLLAKSGDQKPTAEALERVYRRLAQILEKEGVMALEEQGLFDEERQQIMDTRTTNDPSQDNVVCDTVRPGYSFNGKVIRPHQIIVFTFEQASSD